MKTLLLIILAVLPVFITAATTAAPRVSFAFGGDAMFGRMVARTYPGDGLSRVLDNLRGQVFTGVNAAVINLEGPVSDRPLPSNPDLTTMVFNFPPETVQTLDSLGINGVSLANNHTANAGLSGLAATRRLLSGAGITPIGGPNMADSWQIATFSGTVLRLVVIGVNTFTGTPDLAGLIKNLKSDPNARVMIFPHWGVEYSGVHTQSQQQLAHAWIDSGADLVIGSHPHVIQDAEVYKNKPVIYSLGNLVFDQNWSEKTQIGLIVSGVFTADSLKLNLVPVQIVHYQPQIMTGGKKDEILGALKKGLGPDLVY